MIKTAVIPVAGMGTRMLPATKVIAKEMLPVYDKPIIQHVVEEIFEAGIEEIVFVESPIKQPISAHFKPHNEQVHELCQKGKYDLAELLLETVVEDHKIKSVFQMDPLGLGHAILQAQAILDEGPFAVVLPDEVYLGENLPMSELIAFHNKVGGNVIGGFPVEGKQIEQFGIAELGPVNLHGGHRLTGMVEKPKATDAPSNFAIAGRYILNHSIFNELSQCKVGVGGEIQLTDAISASILN